MHGSSGPDAEHRRLRPVDRILAELIAHARWQMREAEASHHLAKAARWERQAFLWATDRRQAIKHLYSAEWRDELHPRVDPATVDPATAEAFARLEVTDDGP